MQLAFDTDKFKARIAAGGGDEAFRYLALKAGIVMPRNTKWLTDEAKARIAMDATAQSELVTVGNSGIPAYLANYFDPEVIAVLVSPMKAAQIIGETKKGDWLSETVTMLVAEAVGEVSSYGDYSMSGTSNVNLNFPVRQNYIFQCFLQYGEREMGIAGLARVNWASEQQQANALSLAKYLNDVYFYGVAGLQNYGLLNDPTLPAPITPQFSWLTSASATANTIYQDIVRLFSQLQAQANGVVQMDEPMVLALSPQNAVALKNITQYNTNSVEVLIKQNFPNLRIETAVQYATATGQLVQLICEQLEGKRTAEAVFSEKMRAHNMIVLESAWRQKRSAGSFGAIIKRPFLIASMLG